jgi:hypothetical protein
VLAILSGFTFSVIWQYSRIYADARGGYVYGEASAVLERITRELRDAGDVDTAQYVSPTYTASYINFSLTHGTPQGNTTLPPPYWIQYCTCSSGGRTYLYRVQNTSKGAVNYCGSGCPMANEQSIMSRNIMGSGFQVRYFQGSSTPDGDSYVITLKLASDGSASNPSITLVTCVSPRNYDVAGLTRRSFNGNYYDQIN